MKTITEPLFQMIDVSSITANNAHMYHPDLVEQLAQSIVEVGLLTPLLVKQTGLQTYELISEQQSLEYRAVIRAKQLNLRKCEMVNVFVIPDNFASKATDQLSLTKILKIFVEKTGTFN